MSQKQNYFCFNNESVCELCILLLFAFGSKKYNQISIVFLWHFSICELLQLRKDHFIFLFTFGGFKEVLGASSGQELRPSFSTSPQPPRGLVVKELASKLRFLWCQATISPSKTFFVDDVSTILLKCLLKIFILKPTFNFILL